MADEYKLPCSCDGCSSYLLQEKGCPLPDMKENGEWIPRKSIDLELLEDKCGDPIGTFKLGLEAAEFRSWKRAMNGRGCMRGTFYDKRVYL